MQTLSPLFLFSKLENFHIIFRIFLLFCFVIATAIIIEISKLNQDLGLILVVAPSFAFALVITMPDIKKMINPTQKGMDKFITTEKPNKTKPEIIDNATEEIVQETKNDSQPKINDLIPLVAELSDYDKKQLRDFKDQIQKLQVIVQDIKLSNTKLEKEILDTKTKIQDLKRKGSTKLEDLETAYAKIMAFKAEIDNPMNFIDKYFQLLNNQELTKKNKKTKPWELLEKIPDIDPEEEPDEATKE